jgi:DNA-binding CsgD family transcriptional regulator
MSKDLSLTQREKEIMDLVILGYTIKEISNILNISETTVISHKQNIKEKLHARNSCHCVSLYIQQFNYN